MRKTLKRCCWATGQRKFTCLSKVLLLIDSYVIIYIHCNRFFCTSDPEHPLVSVDWPVVTGNQYSEVVIPCKPTSRSVTVKLIKEGDEVNTHSHKLYRFRVIALLYCCMRCEKRIINFNIQFWSLILFTQFEIFAFQFDKSEFFCMYLNQNGRVPLTRVVVANVN